MGAVLADPKAGEAGKQDIASCMRILDNHLAGKQFLLGAEYTLADTHASSLTDWLRAMKLDFTPFPNVNAWGARCAARPAYKKTMAASQ